MPITLRFFSFDQADYSYLGAQVHAGILQGGLVTHVRSAPITGDPNSTNVIESIAVFDTAGFESMVDDFPFVFHIAGDPSDSESKMIWRSTPLRFASANQTRRFSIFRIPQDRAVFTQDFLNESIGDELPSVEPIDEEDPDGHEIVMNELELRIRNNTVKASGSGRFQKHFDEGEVTIGGGGGINETSFDSAFTFDYSCTVEPSGLLTNTDKVVNCETRTLDITFDNPVTGTFAGIYNFFTGALEKQVERSFERRFNERIEEELERQLGNFLGNKNAQGLLCPEEIASSVDSG